MEDMYMDHNIIISIFVENNPGVLSRVVSLFGQRSYNIESLTVSITKREDIARITITIKEDDNKATVDQILNQIRKLIEIKYAWKIEPDNALSRDLALIKFDLTNHSLEDIQKIESSYNAKIIYFTENNVVLEIVGEPSDIDKCIKEASDYDITEVCRTGITSIEKKSTFVI